MSDEDNEALAILLFPPLVGILFYIIGEPVGAVLMALMTFMVWLVAAFIWANNRRR